MAVITQLKRGNTNVYPLVHMDGIVDNDGNSLSNIWNTKQEKLVSAGNIKTINGTSLLGGGDLPIVSVDAGDISVLQSTGDSISYVMSQKAVSENVERIISNDYHSLISLPEGYTPLKYINTGASGQGARINTELLPKSKKWRFVGSWRRTGNITTGVSGGNILNWSDGNNYYATSINQLKSDYNTLIVNCYNVKNDYTNITLADGGTVWHTYELSYGKIILDGVSFVLNRNVSNYFSNNGLMLGDVNYPQEIGRFLAYKDDVLMACLEPCINPLGVYGMYDVIREKFYASSNSNVFSGATSQYEEGKKVVNGDLLRSSIEIAKEETLSSKANYLQGRMVYFKLSEYPQFDPRTLDGISIVFAVNITSKLQAWPIFNIMKGDDAYTGFQGNFFGLWTAVSMFLSFGRLSNFSNTLQTGSSRILFNSGNHFVVTYDFNTGTIKFYKNGVLFTTSTSENYDRTTLDTEFATFTHMNICAPPSSTDMKTNGVAIFGYVLNDEDVTKLYGNGNWSIRKSILPITYKANNIHPIYINDWGVLINTGNALQLDGGGYRLTPHTTNLNIIFGFNKIDGVINNVIYEWTFEVISGSSSHTDSNWSRTLKYNSQYFSDFVIYDSNDQDVTLGTLSVGTYRVICKPNNILAGGVNALGAQLLYGFYGCTSDFVMEIKPILKITERGAAIECSIDNFRGKYFKQPNGIHLPLRDDDYRDSTPSVIGVDAYIEDTVIYKSNVNPQFNGQTAVDTTNGKVYVGYLTGTGGTWK